MPCLLEELLSSYLLATIVVDVVADGYYTHLLLTACEEVPDDLVLEKMLVNPDVVVQWVLELTQLARTRS